MITKVLAFIKENHMLQPGERVVVGVSGGADSVCLLFILHKIREWIPVELTVVHVNHKIREEAAQDAAFVEALCKSWGCDYRYVEADVESYAKKCHISTEEAGRLIRYQAFEEALGDAQAGIGGKIAVAHNRNDNAETVLFHLMRGTGLRGLAGISPVRNHIIRPLLCVSRAEIENFLQKEQLSYCIDKTNDEDTYTRNRIRHHILPYAEAEICAQAVLHISDTSVIISEAEAYIRRNAEEALERCLIKKTATELCLDTMLFRNEDAFLQKQMLLLAIELLAGSRKDVGAVHVQMLQGLFLRKGNGRCDLPYGLRAYREYGKVRITKREKNTAENICAGERYERVVAIPGETVWTDGMRLLCRVFPYEKSQIIPQKTYTKWFDYDKIVKSLVLRTRRTGDYLQARQDGGRKSLKAYLIDEKIPKAERDVLPILADESHVLWVIGRRISGHYKIDENTKTVLEIQVTGGTSDGGED